MCMAVKISIAFFRKAEWIIFTTSARSSALKANSLRSLILAERGNLTPTHGRLADHCLAEPLAAGTMGIEELAAAAGVSIATVNRFTRRLGFESHADFRARAVADLHRLMTPDEKLEIEVECPREDMAIVMESLEAALFDLKRTVEVAEPAAWSAAAQAIRGADTVVFLGFGLSSYLVDLFADMIVGFCRAQVVLDGRGGHERVVRRTQSIGPRDLVVAVSLPRYSQATLDHVAQMRAQGAKVLVITDAETSPLLPLADIALVTVAQHPLLHASATPVVAIFEALRALLTARAQDPHLAAELTRRLKPHLYADPAPAAPSGSAAPRISA